MDSDPYHETILEKKVRERRYHQPASFWIAFFLVIVVLSLVVRWFVELPLTLDNLERPLVSLTIYIAIVAVALVSGSLAARWWTRQDRLRRYLGSLRTGGGGHSR